MKLILDDGSEFELMEITSSPAYIYHSYTDKPPLPLFFKCIIKHIPDIRPEDKEEGILRKAYWTFTYAAIKIEGRYYTIKTKNQE